MEIKKNIINNKEDALFVVVLGSGKSINDLSEKQLYLVNSAKVKIAINKFGAFYELAKIKPTHIYFHDDYCNSSILFLKHIFSKFRKEKLKNMTFIISKRYEGYIYKSKIAFIIKIRFIKFLNFSKKISVKIGRLLIKPLSISLFNEFKKIIGDEIKNEDLIKFNLIPKESTVHYVEKQVWNAKGNIWAESLKQKLYHYRGSLTSVLNYISIEYPDHNILLTGVDFNSFGYFFSEDLLNELPFETKDWTTEISRENDKHFSVIDYEGTKLDDELPYVINQLKKTGNKMYSLSRASYLVENGFVEFFEV